MKSWLKTQHTKNKDHGIRSHHFLANRWGKSVKSGRFYFFELQNHCAWWQQPRNSETLVLWKKSYDKPRQHIKNRDITRMTKFCILKSYGFSSSHVRMWELDRKEGWVPRNWCFWIVVLEKTLESPLDCEEIQPVYWKEINPEYSLEWLMLKLKLQYFGHVM